MILVWCLVFPLAATTFAQAERAGRDAAETPTADRPSEAPAERPLGTPHWNLTTEPQVGFVEAMSHATEVAKEYARAILPKQGGAFWIAVLVTFLIAFDWRRPWRSGNIDVVVILALSPLLINIRTWVTRFDDPIAFSQFAVIFRGIYLVTGLLMVRAVIGSRFHPRRCWEPNLPIAPLAGLAMMLVTANAYVAMVAPTDDAGFYVGLGAQRLRETGQFPYGDPFLEDGAAAAYGPVSYLVHLPFQALLERTPANLPASMPVMSAYEMPPSLAAKLCVVTLHLLGVAALFCAGRRLVGSAVGLGLVCLYCASGYVLGLGGDRVYMGGMTFVSHIGPAALSVVAFAFLGVPFLSGMFLAAAAGFLFYPVFFLPAWFGYYFWRRSGWVWFTAGFVLVVGVVGAYTLTHIETGPDESSLSVFLGQTFGHQTHENIESGTRSAYGDSPFGLWGTHPAAREFWQKPLLGSGFTQPVFLALAAFVVLTFFLVRGRSRSQLALLIAAVAMAVNLWKPHAGGTYVTWYFPFLLIGLFAAAPVDPPTETASDARGAEKLAEAHANEDDGAGPSKPAVAGFDRKRATT